MKAFALAMAALLAVAPIQDDFKRERSGKNDELKNSWEGKAPPALKASAWINTPSNLPLSWDKLKGKVVLIDLWAHW
ncbi:MAG: hypothetical protein KDC26_09265 [Armatimonadetes bacterium]|nr:hypothetical protein [Armatimonadota bacterium]